MSMKNISFIVVFMKISETILSIGFLTTRMSFKFDKAFQSSNKRNFLLMSNINKATIQSILALGINLDQIRGNIDITILENLYLHLIVCQTFINKAFMAPKQYFYLFILRIYHFRIAFPIPLQVLNEVDIFGKYQLDLS